MCNILRIFLVETSIALNMTPSIDCCRVEALHKIQLTLQIMANQQEQKSFDPVTSFQPRARKRDWTSLEGRQDYGVLFWVCCVTQALTFRGAQRGIILFEVSGLLRALICRVPQERLSF